MSERTQNDKLLGMLGICMKAGALQCGTEKVCDGIRHYGHVSVDAEQKKKSSGIVIIAKDASANTKKRLLNSCAYYNVECTVSEIDSDELMRRVGKNSAVAAVSTFDNRFVKALKNILE